MEPPMKSPANMEGSDTEKNLTMSIQYVLSLDTIGT